MRVFFGRGEPTLQSNDRRGQGHRTGSARSAAQETLSPHYSRVTELLVVQAFSSVMTQMDAGVMTIEAMRRPGG